VSEILTNTPWVQLVQGDVESLAVGLKAMMDHIQSGHLTSEALPAFPSESDWANEICQICGWL
jgi:hypothetical protein